MELFLMLPKGKIPIHNRVSIDTCDIGNVEVGNNSHGYSYTPTSALPISIVNGILLFVNIKNNSITSINVIRHTSTNATRSTTATSMVGSMMSYHLQSLAPVPQR
ncbi:hypothetical protein Hanom_Chr12g01117061 [Helianthus anomalus]